MSNILNNENFLFTLGIILSFVVLRVFFLRLYVFILLPGTILHEMAHYMFGLLFGGKPFFPKPSSFFPKKENDQIILGSVVCQNITWLNAIPIGLAPLSLFYLAKFFYYNSLLSNSFFVFYITIILILSAIPSKKDIEIALYSSLGIFFWTLVFIVFFKITVSDILSLKRYMECC